MFALVQGPPALKVILNPETRLMSLETALSELTATVATNNALLERVLARANEAKDPVAKGEAGPGPAPEKRRGRPSTKTAEAPATETAPAAPATVEAPAAAPKVAPDKVPTVEELRKAFGDYLGIDNTDERKARADKVRAILAEVGVGKCPEIPEESRAKALAWLEDYKAGRTPNFMADDGEDEGSSLL